MGQGGAENSWSGRVDGPGSRQRGLGGSTEAGGSGQPTRAWYPNSLQLKDLLHHVCALKTMSQRPSPFHPLNPSLSSTPSERCVSEGFVPETLSVGNPHVLEFWVCVTCHACSRRWGELSLCVCHLLFSVFLEMRPREVN